MLLFLTLLALYINFNNAQQVGGSSCAIMNQNMYITGGVASTGKVSAKYTNLIKVALNKAFTVNNFKLQDSPNVDVSSLGSDVNVPNYGAIFGEGVNGTKLWMYGNDNNNPLKYLDLSTGGIITQIKLNSPSNRNAFSWITFNGLLYMYGGRLSPQNNLTNEFWRFNTTDLTWLNVNNNIDLVPLEYSQAVYLTQNRMVVLGGIASDGTVRDLSQVYIFDFRSYSWSVQQCKNGDNYPIVKFTPVAYNNKIIIQGGSSNINSTFKDYKIYNDVMVLDTATWEWRLIQLKNEDTSITNNNYGRAGYSAWLINNQLLQFLGELNDQNANQAQIINLDTFLVAKEYKPPPATWYAKAFAGNDQGGSTTNSINLPLVIGLSVGAAVLLIIGIIIFIYYRKKVKALKKEIKKDDDDFLKPIQPNLNPLWSENDGINHTPNGFSDKFPSINSNDKFNSTFSDNTLNSSNKPSSSLNNSNNVIDNKNPLFALRYDTVLQGESYDDAIKEKFVS